MLLSDLHDLKSDMVLPLGDHDRRVVPVNIVLESYRKMGRVTDNDIRVRHSLHHPAPCHTLLDAADLAFDLGIPFHLLEFFLDLFLGHLHILLKRPALVEQVKCRNRDKYHADSQYHVENLFQHVDPGRSHGHIHHLRDDHDLILQDIIKHHAQDHDLERRFQELHYLL